MSPSFLPPSLRRQLAAFKRGDTLRDVIRARRDLVKTPPEASEAGPAFRPLLASTSGPHSLHQIRADAIMRATEALISHDVPFHRIFRGRDRDVVLVVHEEIFPTACEVIEGSAPSETWHLTRPSSHTAIFLHAAADLSGHLIADSAQGVRIEGWRAVTDLHRPDDGEYPEGALVPPAPGPYSVPFIAPDGTETTSDAFTFTEPIDVVYTWVDNSDPDWRARYARALGEESDQLHAGATDPVRFTSFDELRYSLRSVLTYADWVRNIYIVTDGQVPEWLDTSHSRIKMVDHLQILDAPVFNSHAIESRLHRIPGLSEHYLYLNDDVFFGNEVFPEDFFASPTVHYFAPSYQALDDRPAEPADPPIMAAAKNGRDLLESAFGKRVHFKMEHTVHPQQRSVITALEAQFPQEFERVGHSALRHYQDISVASSLSHWYGFLTGRAIPRAVPVFYTNLTRSDAPQQLDALYSLRRYSTFCLNFERGDGDWESAADEMVSFLKKYFPYAAPWERATNDSPQHAQ
ncbi:Stealth protein CR3, conserved region 3 [Ruaniaceae bacterium KH17]|nr:Stealth protein CR3, conserved region 3 [Ruaniaceae bacterium KH17]